MIDLDLFRQIAEQLYMPIIAQEHGAGGELALRKIMETLHKLYRHISPETYPDQIVVFKTIDDAARPLEVKQAKVISDLSILPATVNGPITIQLLANEQILLWNNLAPNIEELSLHAVVYTYNNRTEHFYAKGIKRLVQKVDPAYASVFSMPTFSELADALEHYRTKMVRQSSCEILSRAWADTNRIFVKNAQEWVMRKSLTQFLKSHLRGNFEVRPEQIVDESHPVDIKVTWWGTNNLAIIEIKWLGKSKNDDGTLGTEYTAARAREGAKQLAEYLDENIVQAPLHITRGYLVIIDIRRARVNKDTTTVSSAHGLHYQHKELEFDPKYHETRSDFEVPIRMFVEPICACP